MDGNLLFGSPGSEDGGSLDDRGRRTEEGGRRKEEGGRRMMKDRLL